MTTLPSVIFGLRGFREKGCGRRQQRLGKKGCGRGKLKNKADGAVVTDKGSEQSVALKNYKIRQTVRSSSIKVRDKKVADGKSHKIRQRVRSPSTKARNKALL